MLEQHPVLNPCSSLGKVAPTTYIFKNRYLSSQVVVRSLFLQKDNAFFFFQPVTSGYGHIYSIYILTHTEEATSVLRCESFHFCSLINRFKPARPWICSQTHKLFMFLLIFTHIIFEGYLLQVTNTCYPAMN